MRALSENSIMKADSEVVGLRLSKGDLWGRLGVLERKRMLGRDVCVRVGRMCLGGFLGDGRLVQRSMV